MSKRAGALVLAVAGIAALFAVGVGSQPVAAQACYPPPAAGQTCPPTGAPTDAPTDRPTDRPVDPTDRPNPPGDDDDDDEGGAGASACLIVRGEDGNIFVAGVADFRSRLEIEGAAECARPFGDITVVVRSDPVELGTFQALEDGSFHHIFCLPPAVEVGRHTVHVSIEGRGLRSRPLVVQDNNKKYCGPGDGTVVLGNDTSNTGGTSGQVAGGRGFLPRTGAGIYFC